MKRPRVAVITGGHRFDEEGFRAVFESLEVDWFQIEHPAAQALFSVDAASEIDVFVLYDMPGIEFTGHEPPARLHQPPDDYVKNFIALLERGQGMVFLHHAIAGWPAWPRYAQIVGGYFNYQSKGEHGLSRPDSGYRHGVRHTVEVVEIDHPVCAGLEPTFEIRDEVYLFTVFEGDVTPLMQSHHIFTADNFYSANLAIRGQRDSKKGWSHPDGSNLVAWTKRAGNSPVVYLQFGDGPDVYGDANYRKSVGNAISWVSSSGAHDWASEHPPVQPSN